jgi:hypothetical protein
MIHGTMNIKKADIFKSADFYFFTLISGIALYHLLYDLTWAELFKQISFVTKNTELYLFNKFIIYLANLRSAKSLKVPDLIGCATLY